MTVLTGTYAPKYQIGQTLTPEQALELANQSFMPGKGLPDYQVSKIDDINNLSSSRMYAGPESGWIDKAMQGWKQRENGIVPQDRINLFHYMGKNPDDPTSQGDAGYHYVLTKGGDGKYRVDNADYSGGLRAQDTDNNNRFNLSEFAVKGFLGAALGGAAGFGPLAGGNAAGAIGSGAAAGAGEGSLASQWAAMGANGVPTLTMGEGAAAGGGLLGDAAQGFRTAAPSFGPEASQFGNYGIDGANALSGSGMTGVTGLANLTPAELAAIQSGIGLDTTGLGLASGATTLGSPFSPTMNNFGQAGSQLTGSPNFEQSWTDKLKDPKNLKNIYDMAQGLFGQQPMSSGGGAGTHGSGQSSPYMAGLMDIGGRIQNRELPILDSFHSGLFGQSPQASSYARGLMNQR